MDSLSLALAFVGTLDLCVKYGAKLKSFCREQRNVRADIDEIILILEGVWLKTEAQLKLLTTLVKTESLDAVLRNHYLRALKQLETNLSGAVIALEDVSKRNLNHSGSKFPLDTKVVFIKRELQLLVADLEEWQRRFAPSWYLITLVSQSAVDKQPRLLEATPESPISRLFQLREVIHGAHDSLDPSAKESILKASRALQGECQQIPYTSAYLSRSHDDTRDVIQDQTNYPQEAIVIASRAHVRDLALLMCNVDPFTFGLLKCEGVIEVNVDHKPQYEFIFEVPSGLHTMRTLRSLILEEPQCSLTKRVQLAKQLARSVMFVHTIGFVHKGIRPETILVFSQEEESVGSAFLTGFEKIGSAESQTGCLGDLEWERNLYRHPVRQGFWSEEAFTMHHDIYSLGVCLLEIALWRSFVEINGALKTPWAEMGIEEAIADKDARGSHEIQRRLVTMAQQRLPCLVGDRYTNLVTACLCCLDPGEDNVFNIDGNTNDDDGVIIGVRFIEQVLSKLDELLI